ncbi:MAG: four helix bundle protein [Planctomycetota bacterium]
MSGDRSQIRSFRDLRAWQLAFQLGLDVYRETESFPQDERFGLTAQIRRSAISVASNIAEGYGRGSTSDYVRFLRIARGSLHELETQLMFARELRLLEPAHCEALLRSADDAGRVLGGLIRSISR